MSIKPPRFITPRYVHDGDLVWIPWPTPEKPRQGARVRVVCAAGNHARVVNETLKVDQWFRVDDLLIPTKPLTESKQEKETAPAVVKSRRTVG